MKRSKLNVITKILAIVIVCLISFAGIYVQKGNKISNIVKSYTLSKDLEGYRQIILEVSDATQVLDENGDVVGTTDSYDDDTIETYGYTKSDEAVNSEDDLTENNYEISREIIEKRLKDLGVTDYYISVDKKTGKIYMQIPEDENTDTIVSYIANTGEISIRDSEDDTVYITSDNLKSASTMYTTTTSGTIVYLEIAFDKQGKETLAELSTGDYATIEEEEEEEETEETETSEAETTEETEDVESSETEDIETEETENTEDEDTDTEEEEEVQKEVILSINDSDVVTTSFDDPIENGKIDLTINSATTDEEELSEYFQSASISALLLNNGEMPITYTTTENQYVSTEIATETIRNIIIVVSAIIAILLVYMIIKNKIRGLLSAISFIGFAALYLLVIRYTNVTISIDGIISIILVLILNYLVSMKLLNISNKKDYYNEYWQILLKMIPILAISIIFCFMNMMALSSFGMLMFWGIVLISIYNVLITKNIVD